MKTCKKCFSPALPNKEFCIKHLSESTTVIDFNVSKALEISRIEGVLLGLKICKEMWAQGQMSHENIYENEVLYMEELKKLIS